MKCAYTPIENHATLDQAREQLARVITPHDDVVAHGLTVPLLLHFAQHHPIKRAFVSNGPLTSLDAFLQKLFYTPLFSAKNLFASILMAFRFLHLPLE